MWPDIQRLHMSEPEDIKSYSCLLIKDKDSRKMKIIVFFLILSSNLYSQSKPDNRFNGFEGTMVVYDLRSNSYTIFNQKRAATRFSPFSTYKIPNSIIALETKVIENVDQIIKWDKNKYPQENWWPKTWQGEHNLRSAIKYSVVPAYRHLAGLIGKERMQSYLNLFDYGNKDLSSAIDNFWLNGSLKISALEQVEFLKKFYQDQLKISPRTIMLVKSILIREQTENYKLSAKTGAGNIDKDKDIALGWYVGYVEKENNVYFFALNIEGQGFNEILKPRIEITKSILKELGIIE